ncbi:MAG: hypothetical protein ABII06_01450 [Pseudomonadota bacterium]
MPKFPKLKVTHWIDGQATREELEFEQAPDFLFNFDVLVVVEGTVVRSYEELLALASEDAFRDRAFLEVRMETVIGGG